MIPIANDASRTVTGIVYCDNAEMLRDTMVLTNQIVSLDKQYAWKVITRPGGVEVSKTVTFQPSNYFSSIDIQPNNNLSFLLIFYIRAGVTSFWKDMMFAILREIKQIPGVKTFQVK